MKMAISKAVVISLVIGFIMSLFSSILTTSYFVHSELFGSDEVLFGIAAIKHTIRELGVWAYFTGVLATMVLYTGSIFVGCLWMSRWTKTGTQV